MYPGLVVMLVLAISRELLIDCKHHNNFAPSVQAFQRQLSLSASHRRLAPIIGPKRPQTELLASLITGNSTTAATNEDKSSSTPLDHPPLSLGEVDVLYGRTSSLLYDPVQERYVLTPTQTPIDNLYDQQVDNQNNDLTQSITTTTEARSSFRLKLGLTRFLHHTILPRLAVAFLPAGVTPNYYRFTKWRILQRFVSSNLHVIGTQSLLLGLGIQATRSQLTALSAALNWVLKDALGKLVRMLWASKMGRRFDSDAKRWRFRASFLYAAGNGLEIVTCCHPAAFLIWATAANCCKQVSMLTSSSTRTALYNSFRDGTRENIGDITAKGEAQIAVVDLMGIASGVSLSRAVGTSVRSIAVLYAILQATELVFMYRQLRAVHYRVLNFERLVHVIQQFCRENNSQDGTVRLDAQEMSSNTTATATTTTTNAMTMNTRGNGSSTASYSKLSTPQDMAEHEPIFWPPPHLSRRAIAYGSLGRAKLAPEELEQLLNICSKERFLLIVGPNVKNPQRSWIDRCPSGNRARPISTAVTNKESAERIARVQENCHIVLHADATNVDIVKSTLALTLLREKLARLAALDPTLDPETLRSSDCFDLIASSLQEANIGFPRLLRSLTKNGWESPARYMFGRVQKRATWPLVSSSKPAKST